MQILLFQENSQITPEYLHHIFLQKEDIIEKLELAKILIRRLPRIDIDDNFTKRENLKEYYAFRFVGVVIVDDFCLVVYPKYIKEFERDYFGSQKKIIQILKVIEKSQMLNSYDHSATGDGENLLLLMISILNNYLDNGLYSSDKAVIETNGEGNILWEKTIDESIAYIINDTPYYLDIYTENSVINELDIIRKLHAAIVNEISIKLQPILSIFEISEIVLPSQELNDFGDINYVEYLLEQEISKQFVTSKQILLTELLDYVLKTNKTDIRERIEVYGTTSFNLVWETICNKIYKDDLKKELSSLNLTLYKEATEESELIDFRNKKLLKDIVEVPVWNKKGNPNTFEATKSLELDVLHINHDEKRFEIFDGKYYSINFSEKFISGQPGVNDITKQYLYQLAFKDLAEINDYQFFNAFVIPKDELKEDSGAGVDYATVELKMLRQLGLENINVIARDCELFYEQYLSM